MPPEPHDTPDVLLMVDGLILTVRSAMPPGARPAAARYLLWLRRLRGDRNALAVLEEARQAGLDVPRLLAAAGTYRTGRGVLTGPTARIEFGGVVIAPLDLATVNARLAEAERTEATLGRPSADAAELRVLRDELKRLATEMPIDEVLTTEEPDGKGGLREQRWMPVEPGIAIAVGTVGPGRPALGGGVGSPGDQALSVLVEVVLGHARKVAPSLESRALTKLIVRGLLLGLPDERGGPSHAADAMRQRVRRCLGKPNDARSDRAALIAEKLGLPFARA